MDREWRAGGGIDRGRGELLRGIRPGHRMAGTPGIAARRAAGSLACAAAGPYRR